MALYNVQIIFMYMSSFGPHDPEKQRQQMPLVLLYSCLWGLSELPGAELAPQSRRPSLA